MLAYIIKTPYNAGFVDELKLETVYHRWNKEDRTWTVGKDDIDAVMKLLEKYFDEDDDTNVYTTNIAAYAYKAKEKRRKKPSLFSDAEMMSDEDFDKMINDAGANALTGHYDKDLGLWVDDLPESFNAGESIQLSAEQERFIEYAKEGNNILVDACIGSGKTTTIQRLCDVLSKDKKILYFTYNRLLKIDARDRIKADNTLVMNYHSFARMLLLRKKISCGVSDMIQVFNVVKPKIDHYDVIVIDEYQDIDQEIADMLLYIKRCLPEAQLIAVGDMKQKIYDKTSLKVQPFIDEFLGDHVTMEFTQCFRLSKDIAEMLGRIWGKKIVGVNKDCEIMRVNPDSAVYLMSKLEPKDILCLGSLSGTMADTLNLLEKKYSSKFNKRTVYARISSGHDTGATQPTPECAIFTTYDGSKGLERPWCFIFDFTLDYWIQRSGKPQQSYEVLRNIFCVAASRGKKRVVFVSDGNEPLDEKTLSTNFSAERKFADQPIGGMFDFKFKEDIEDCYKLLNVKEIEVNDHLPINVKGNDELIDLTPCIGTYQQAVFFSNTVYNIDNEIELTAKFSDIFIPHGDELKDKSLDEKVLLLTAADTRQARYVKQVKTPFVKEEEKNAIIDRLGSVFHPVEQVQQPCAISFDCGRGDHFSAEGIVDVIKDNTVYELKFVAELNHEAYLQTAAYMVATGLKKGVLWNVRDNTRYEIEIPDEKKFMDAVVKAVTKGEVEEYKAMPGEPEQNKG